MQADCSNAQFHSNIDIRGTAKPKRLCSCRSGKHIAYAGDTTTTESGERNTEARTLLLQSTQECLSGLVEAASHVRHAQNCCCVPHTTKCMGQCAHPAHAQPSSQPAHLALVCQRVEATSHCHAPCCLQSRLQQAAATCAPQADLQHGRWPCNGALGHSQQPRMTYNSKPNQSRHAEDAALTSITAGTIRIEAGSKIV